MSSKKKSKVLGKVVGELEILKLRRQDLARFPNPHYVSQLENLAVGKTNPIHRFSPEEQFVNVV